MMSFDVDLGHVHALLFGMLAMASLVASLAFLKFWQVTADRFFGMFALSFMLMSVNRVALALIPLESEGRTFFYWLRLFAYVIILLAILDKNRPHRPARSPEDP